MIESMLLLCVYDCPIKPNITGPGDDQCRGLLNDTVVVAKASNEGGVEYGVRKAPTGSDRYDSSREKAQSKYGLCDVTRKGGGRSCEHKRKVRRIQRDKEREGAHTHTHSPTHHDAKPQSQ